MSLFHSVARCVLIVVCFCTVVHSTVAQQPKEARSSEAKASASLNQLAWLAGSWVGTGDGQAVEEHWMRPEGGMIVGMNRTIYANGKASFEFLRIAGDGDKLTFYASPSGQPATPFLLKEIAETRVVFENLKNDFPQRIMYERKDGTLHAAIEGEVNGKLQVMKWTWTLRGDAPTK